MQNIFLTIASVVFFAWGGVSKTSILLLSIAANYLFGRAIAQFNKYKLWFLSIAIVLNIANLAYFKYWNFIINNCIDLGIPLEKTNIILPIGISFYTFHCISYLVDVYRGNAGVQKSLPQLALYICLFPQLIAGPIIRYETIKNQLAQRNLNLQNLTDGLERFIIGLAKKLLIANSFAFIADKLWGFETSNLDSVSAWIAVLAYSFQIYTDFSAYSDMAIGLAKIVGFTFPENFNFPYLGKNFKDFWSRWHISLSTWFRDYLYIPLGGNRKKTMRVIINLLIVFMCTGFWHGASFNFLFWGLLHGFFLLIERYISWNKIFPKVFQIALTFLLVTLIWIPFRAKDFTYTFDILKRLFSFNNGNEHSYNLYILHSLFSWDVLILCAIGILGSFGVFKSVNLNKIFTANGNLSFTIGGLKYAFLLICFVICTMFITAGTYSPFIYFRF